MALTFKRFAAAAGMAGALCILAACGKEAKPSPQLLPDAFQLPQGNHAFDNEIVAFKKQYGTYILYKFNYRDFAYNNTGYLSDTAALGDPAYVGQLIQVFKESLSVFPESFIKTTVPFKIILSSAIGAPLPGGAINVTTGFAASPEMLGIGWTKAELEQQTPEERKAFLASLRRYYMYRAALGKSVVMPNEFLALWPASISGITENNKYQFGMLEVQAPNRPDRAQDFSSYTQAIMSHTTAELEATILSPQKDTKGIVRRKYNIVLNYFREKHNLDLAAIGNRP